MVHLLLGGEHGENAALLFERDPKWAAPAILTSEQRKVLLAYVRRGDLTADQANKMCHDAAEVLRGRTATVATGHVLDVALECDLSTYDAECVALARTLRVPLVTLDGRILRKAGDVAISPRDH